MMSTDNGCRISAIRCHFQRSHCRITYYVFLWGKKNNNIKKKSIWKSYQSKERLFEAMVTKFDRFVSRMDAICRRHGEKDNERVDGQSGRVPDAQYQSPHVTDPAE